jgi:hypothetical protein
MPQEFVQHGIFGVQRVMRLGQVPNLEAGT